VTSPSRRDRDGPRSGPRDPPGNDPIVGGRDATSTTADPHAAKGLLTCVRDRSSRYMTLVTHRSGAP
jgi:hypothetical protein